MALIDKLNAIGDAIREKTGKEEKLTLDQMPVEIASITTGGGDLPEDALVLTGDQDYAFASNSWNWFIEEYGDQITTRNITNASYMFMGNSLESIPFEINLAGTTIYMFHMSKIKVAPKFTGDIGHYEDDSSLQGETKNLSYMFASCRYLKEIPNPEFAKGYGLTPCSGVFDGCYSLREVPPGFMKMLDVVQNSLFEYCTCLNEVVNLPVTPAGKNVTFSRAFYSCNRLARLTFETNEDGSPKVEPWNSNVTIDLSQYVGYASDASYILNYNSGITADKQVTNLSTYNALKNDPDWFTTNVAYSRYNKTSAIETINSLPDVSGGGKTYAIKFKGDSGSLTDGGAINTMTASEIAVATAKGWTVSFV
ncbi:MAG: hypothetical protein IKY67_06570 [Paludibacteraceae bacterium]|nr:hypothetical protein [Paludibacteraceae bacterium]